MFVSISLTYCIYCFGQEHLAKCNSREKSYNLSYILPDQHFITLHRTFISTANFSTLPCNLQHKFPALFITPQDFSSPSSAAHFLLEMTILKYVLYSSKFTIYCLCSYQHSVIFGRWAQIHPSFPHLPIQHSVLALEATRPCCCISFSKKLRQHFGSAGSADSISTSRAVGLTSVCVFVCVYLVSPSSHTFPQGAPDSSNTQCCAKASGSQRKSCLNHLHIGINLWSYTCKNVLS